MRISDWSSDVCSSDLIADRIVRDVMTIIIAEGEESMIVDMHLIAGLHVGKAKEVRIAPAIEEEDISGLGHRVEPPTGRLSAFDINTRAPTITPFDALMLDGHRPVHRMIQHSSKHRRRLEKPQERKED